MTTINDDNAVNGIMQKRVLATAIPGPQSQTLHQRRTTAVSAGVGATLPIFIAKAAGGIVVDVDGNQLIDFGSGIAVTSVGNSAPAVVDRITAQVKDFTHTCFMVTEYEEYVEVCEALNRLTPGTHEKRSALFNTGAEAVENAVKIARSATGRQAIAVFEHGYHGRTNLTLGMTAKNMPYKHTFGPFAPEIYRFPTSYPFHDELSGPDAAKLAISRMEKELGGSNIAAIVLEPIQGEGGFVVPAPGFMSALADYAKAQGILFIADEVQTGFCRTGNWFASEHEGIVPDLITTAKGIAGGMPLAGVTGRADIMDAIHAGGLGGTYGGNPVACAAALGSIETMEQFDLVNRAKDIEAIMLPRLNAIATQTGVIGEVRGRGAMIAVEIVQPGTKNPDPELTAKVAKACHAQGLVVLTAGTYGNVLRFLPPLVIPNHLLTEALDIITEQFVAATA
ncbi:MAG: 4-aminobutyrate--2-oxoglutarate transaminase [Actinomycetes bacterium]